MARKKTIYVGALNITLHEHSPPQYVHLLDFTKKRKLTARYRGERHAMVGYFREEPGTNGAFRGQLFSFMELDPNDTWFNQETGKPAKEDELDGVHLPSNLKPGMRIFNFLFFPQEHLLFFESKSVEGYSLGPKSAQSIFQSLFKSQELISEFGHVDVTIEPSEEALDKVLGLHRIDRLWITLTRPNPDDNKDDAQIIERRLYRQNAQELTEHLHAVKDESLAPDEETRRLAEIASHNGYVSSKGKDELGDPHEESTKQHPLKQREQFDPETETVITALFSVARRIIAHLGK